MKAVSRPAQRLSGLRVLERRKTIVDAGLSCFSQFGFAKTSFADIAQRAGVSRPTIYQHFPNKEAILEAAYVSLFEETLPRAREAVAQGGTKKDRLMRVCEITVLEPWSILRDAPMAKELQAQCANLAPEIVERTTRKWVALVQEILGDRLVSEVFARALEGLTLDTPTLAVLRKRTMVLVDRFVA